MNKQKRNKVYPKELKIKLLNKYKSSKNGLLEFCRENEISPNTFKYWLDTVYKGDNASRRYRISSRDNHLAWIKKFESRPTNQTIKSFCKENDLITTTFLKWRKMYCSPTTNKSIIPRSYTHSIKENIEELRNIINDLKLRIEVLENSSNTGMLARIFKSKSS